MTTRHITGEKFGRLTLLYPTENKKDGKRIWKFLCECGNETYSNLNEVVRGKKKSCGCLAAEARQETARKQGLANRRFTPMISSARKVWKHYKDGCDFDTFFALSQLSCYYCGTEPYRIYNLESRNRSSIQSEQGDFIYNGLDRIDSSKTHTSDNIVPCCWDCNDMKKDRTHDEFLAHIKRIFIHKQNK